MIPVVFAHGLEGHPEGTKASALRAAGMEVLAPDCRGCALAERISRVGAALDQQPGAILVGSSYGGLAAAWIASRRPEVVGALVLLAPALSLREAPVEDPEQLVVPPSVPTTIVHGLGDDVIPVAVSRALVARCPHVRLVEVPDRHELRGSLPRIVEEVRAFQPRKG
jgi:hypothetical protein